MGRAPEPEDRLVVVTASAESFVCGLVDAFQTSRTVRLTLPGSPPHVLRSVLNGSKQTVCKLEGAETVLRDDGGATCSATPVADSGTHVTLDATVCRPYAG